jgi:hypothetical protein
VKDYETIKLTSSFLIKVDFQVKVLNGIEKKSEDVLCRLNSLSALREVLDNQLRVFVTEE